MGGSKKEKDSIKPPTYAAMHAAAKDAQQEADVADIETNADLYIKKKRKGKRSLRVPAGGASVPTEGASGISLPS